MSLLWREKQAPQEAYQRLDLPEGYVNNQPRSGDDHPLVFAVVDWIALNARQVLPTTSPGPQGDLARSLITPTFLENAIALLLLEGLVTVRVHRDPGQPGFPRLLEPVPLARLTQENGQYYVVPSLAGPNGVVGQPELVARRNIFQVRLRNTKSPLRVLTEDLLTEDEAAKVVNSLLRKRGLLGLVISPAPGQPPWSEPTTEAVRSAVTSRTSGNNRGDTLAIGAPVNIESYNNSGVYEALAAVRNIPEEHVAAVFHVSAAVVGFGTGIQQTAVGATLLELRAIAWSDGLLPHVSRLYEGASAYLAGPNGLNSPGLNIDYTTAGVAALADTRYKDAMSWAQLVLAGIASPSAAARALGIVEEF